eukprot:gb/GEZN01005361.1/.p1 GENE.gb/GEZN01005361.1/~~gb/GEZN01005361.1/.p1  ORF type:complete len:552 (+),score=47.97 gb/GEZN01005361.1/:223-1656(+)
MFFSGFSEGVTNTVEICVPDVHPRAFGVMLQHLYTDTETLSYDIVLFVIYCAKKYQIWSLVEVCFTFMESKLTPENACIILESAPHLLDTWTYAIEFIEKNASEVLDSDAFLRLSPESLARVIKSNNLGVSEMQIFESCLQWARKECSRKGMKHAPANIRQVLLPILQHIRFPVMTIEQIATEVSPRNILTSDELLHIFIHVGKGKEEPKLLQPSASPPDVVLDVVHPPAERATKEEEEVRERKELDADSSVPDSKHTGVGRTNGTVEGKQREHKTRLSQIRFDSSVRSHHTDEWCLDPDHRSPHVQLSRNATVCEVNLNNLHGFVSGTKVFSRGKHAWRVELNRMGWAYIGICSAARRRYLTKTSFADPSSYGFSNRNQRYVGGVPRRYKCKRPAHSIDWGEGHRIDVLLDLEEREVKFCNLNSQKCWIIRNLPADTRWVPHFNLYAMGTKASVQVIQLSEWAMGRSENLMISLPI